MHVRTNFLHDCKLFAFTDFVEMVVSRSSRGVGPLGVAALQDIWVGIEVLDLDDVFKQWEDETDMPRIGYDYTSPRDVLGIEMW